MSSPLVGSMRRKVLLICYSCSPLWGSEPGVGWRWFVELSKIHDVTLVTHTFYREHLAGALDAIEQRGGSQVEFLDAPRFGMRPEVYLNSRAYYLWWLLSLRRYVAARTAREHFDVVHHLTWGSCRFPNPIARGRAPIVLGPLGGGEAAPWRLYGGLPLSVRLIELARAVSLLSISFDPLIRRGLDAAAVILCKTAFTQAALPKAAQAKSAIAFEIGAAAKPSLPAQDRSRHGQPGRLLFAGRLLGLKGIALALGAVADLKRRGVAVHFDIAGEGPLRGVLERRIERLGLADAVSLLGALPRDVLMERYRHADLFVFPSLHDSSGNVVLEALSSGLPVLCLDLGGPQNYVSPECGVVVSTARRSRVEVEVAMADAIERLLCTEGALARMSDAARECAASQTWEQRVRDAYGLIGERLGWTEGEAGTGTRDVRP